MQWKFLASVKTEKMGAEAADTPLRKPKFRRIKKWVFFPLVSICITLVLIEFISWLAWPLAPENGKHNISVLLGDLNSDSAWIERPHPYMLWENVPGFSRNGNVRQINNLGYRNSSDFGFANPDKFKRLLCIGGSTTFGFPHEDPSIAWPEQLEKLLNEQSGHEKFQVINAGLLFGTSAEFLSHYMYRDRYLQGVELVILHMGGNDALTISVKDYDPEYRNLRSFEPNRVSLRPGEEWFLRNSRSVRLFYAFWLNGNYAAAHIQKGPDSEHEISPEEFIANVRKNEPLGFRRNLSLLIRNIIADGKKVILVPFLLSPVVKAGAEPVEVPNSIADCRLFFEGYLVANAKTRQVMKEMGTLYDCPVSEIPPGMISVEHFYDDCHLDEAGEKAKARFVFDQVVQLSESDSLSSASIAK